MVKTFQLKGRVCQIRFKKKKQDSAICCLQEINFKIKNTSKLKGKGWK